MYQDFNSEKNSPDKHRDSDLIYDKERYSFNTTYQAENSDLISSTAVDFFHRSQAFTDTIMSPTKHRENKVKNLVRSKPFEIPFERYHYRDFLWKISFNRNFHIENSVQPYRYYVGKGNNSRLVRRIMSKRGWGVEQQKQENAHFIGTQLKIYDVYKNQRSEVKKPQ